MNWCDFRAMEEKGQSLLIVVLVMVVALTVGLSVVLRSITNVRIATEEENSQRAFSAAESGIEQALKTGADISDKALDNRSSIKEVKVLTLSGKQFLINSGNPVLKNDAVDLWLIDHNTNGSLNYSSGWQQNTQDASLTIYWGTSADPCANAALEVVVVSGTQNAPAIKRYAWDSCTSTSRSNNNSFDASLTGPVTVGVKTFYFRKDIVISSASKGILVRINPLYFNTPLAVKGCGEAVAVTHASCVSLPSQGKIIESTGIADNTVRKVTFYQGYSKIPSEFFPYGLFITN